MATKEAYVPLKRVLPKGMQPKRARAILRSDRKFKPHEGRWEFPKKQVDKVSEYLIQNK